MVEDLQLDMNKPGDLGTLPYASLGIAVARLLAAGGTVVKFIWNQRLVAVHLQENVRLQRLGGGATQKFGGGQGRATTFVVTWDVRDAIESERDLSLSKRSRRWSRVGKPGTRPPRRSGGGSTNAQMMGSP